MSGTRAAVAVALLASVADGFSPAPSGLVRDASVSRLSLASGVMKRSSKCSRVGLNLVAMTGQREEGSVERRGFLGLAGWMAGVVLCNPADANADMAAMGKDVLDRWALVTHPRPTCLSFRRLGIQT